ncbi:hypothetical protein CLAFUR4_14477 [Fulvia fulva]|nr:hypothetical protein CLAFUR4_14477 [Fulvia fulva]WPV37743.1 hypothetical protein CLAFUW7_14486 [Fulvia fulva]
MSRPYHDDHSGGIPQYCHPDQQQQPHHHHQPPPPRQRPAGHNSSRIPQPTYAAQDRRRNQPHMNPAHSTASPGRGQRHHQEPYHPEQSAWDASQNLYEGSAFEEGYVQHDQWPLPAEPSPQPSPRDAHASSNVNSSPRKPPRRPQRPDESPLSENRRPSRESPRGIPRVAEQPPPIAPLQPSHHGSGQWTGDGYAYTAPMHPPPSRPLPPTTAGGQSGIPQYVTPPIPQQAVYGHANRRPPLGPPPSARRGPPTYYPQVGPVHPIAEETDSMRGSIKTGSVRTGDHNSKTSFASSNAIPIGIPQFYVDDRYARPSIGGNSTTAGGRPSTPTDFRDADDQFVDEEPGRRLENSGFAEDEPVRDQHSPVLVRQASIGKRSKPTLVNQKSGDHIRKTSTDSAGVASLPSRKQSRRASKEPPPVMIDTQHGIDALYARASSRTMPEGQAGPGAHDSDKAGDGNKPRNALAILTGGKPNEETRKGARSNTSEGDLRSGTGLLDVSSDESESDLRKQRSRELLGAALTTTLFPEKERIPSPLAPTEDQRVNHILTSLEKGGAITSEEADELKKPMGGLSDRSNKRRPPRLDVDAVRDAEARGSLTSLPDLIKRATKLASNLDRGKTASRLGMGHWLEGAPDAEKRRSGSIADMLNAFPPPQTSTSRESRNGWRNSRLRHSELPSDSDAGGPKKARRRCCGMPLWVFILVMILLFLLVAAAVVVPVMLLVYVPSQNKDSSSSSSSTAKQCEQVTCYNGGVNVVGRSDQCRCVCTNGYTGPHCSVMSAQGCTRISIGSDEATVGEAVPRLLRSAASNFSVPLDGQEVLGMFSQNNLDCAAQNALVSFNSASSKRLMVDITVEHVNKRQDPATTNGMVTAGGSATATTSPSATATSASGTNANSTDRIADDTALDFARVTVLYVLQETQDLGRADGAQMALQDYFRGTVVDGDAPNAHDISLGGGISCSVADYRITLSNGTTVGGGSGNSSTGS